MLPVLVDLARGERPGSLALAGPPATRRRAARLRPPVPVLLALVAAGLFGLFFVGVDRGGAAAGGASSGSPSGSSWAPCPPPWPAPWAAGAALAVLGTLVVSAAQAAA